MTQMEVRYPRMYKTLLMRARRDFMKSDEATVALCKTERRSLFIETHVRSIISNNNYHVLKIAKTKIVPANFVPASPIKLSTIKLKMRILCKKKF